MKTPNLRSAALLAFAPCALSAHALTLTNVVSPSVVRPQSGQPSILAVITGTVTAGYAQERVYSYSSPGTNSGTPNSFNYYLNAYTQGNAGNTPLTAPTTYAAQINAALAATGSYTGPIEAFAITSSTSVGLYDQRTSGGGLPAAVYLQSNIGTPLDAVAPFSVMVTPEPSALAALGLGALGMLRRRKR